MCPELQRMLGQTELVYDYGAFFFIFAFLISDSSGFSVIILNYSGCVSLKEW